MRYLSRTLIASLIAVVVMMVGMQTSYAQGVVISDEDSCENSLVLVLATATWDDTNNRCTLAGFGPYSGVFVPGLTVAQGVELWNYTSLQTYGDSTVPLENYGAIVNQGSIGQPDNATIQTFVLRNHEGAVINNCGHINADNNPVENDGEIYNAGSIDHPAAPNAIVQVSNPDWCPRTYVELASFTAAATGDSVKIDWATSVEVDNAGFNLYRASAEDTAYVKINGDLIAAQGNGTGASYTYTDAGLADGSYFYKLEDVDYNGAATLHGPIQQQVGSSAVQYNYYLMIPMISVGE